MNETGSPSATHLLVVSEAHQKEIEQGDDLFEIETDSSDHGEVDKIGKTIAAESVGRKVHVYQRIATYEAEVKVVMRKAGE